MPPIIGARITPRSSTQTRQYANLAADYFKKVYTDLPNDPHLIPRAIAKSNTNKNIKLSSLFEKFKGYMDGTLHYDDPAIAEEINAAIENDAYELLERYAPHQLTPKGLKDKFGPRVVVAEAILEAMAAYKKMIALAKPAFETIKPVLKDVRPISNRVLRQATAREEHTIKANEVLELVGINKNFFRLNDDYLALLAKAEDKNATLTLKEQQILKDYKELESVVLEKLKSNKIAKQMYGDARKMALGMEKLRRESVAERAAMIEYNKDVIKAADAEFEYDLLGQFPWPVLST